MEKSAFIKNDTLIRDYSFYCSQKGPSSSGQEVMNINFDIRSPRTQGISLKTLEWRHQSTCCKTADHGLGKAGKKMGSWVHQRQLIKWNCVGSREVGWWSKEHTSIVFFFRKFFWMMTYSCRVGEAGVIFFVRSLTSRHCCVVKTYGSTTHYIGTLKKFDMAFKHLKSQRHRWTMDHSCKFVHDLCELATEKEQWAGKTDDLGRK